MAAISTSVTAVKFVNLTEYSVPSIILAIQELIGYGTNEVFSTRTCKSSSLQEGIRMVMAVRELIGFTTSR